MDLPSLTAIRVDHDPGQPIAHLVFDRPEWLNALSRVLLTEVVTACRWLDGEHQIKVVVVGGEGRAFSAGFDLQARAEAKG